jgi:protein-disulfide isomerase
MSKNKDLKNKFNKELQILLISVVLILLGASTIYYFTRPVKDEAVVIPTPTAEVSLFRSFNHKIGPENAKVQIVEFYDPECESCSAFFPYVNEIKSRYKNQIQLITRYALYHSNSLLAAKASDAAGRQGKFWEFQELLFLNQHKWSHQQTPALSVFGALKLRVLAL